MTRRRFPTVAALGALLVAIGGSLILGLSAAVGADPAATAQLAAATPADPAVLFHEDFEDMAGQWQSLTSYQGSGGTTYAASPYWSSNALCNGLVTLHTASPSPASACPQHAALSIASRLVPLASGSSASDTNHVLAWYSYDPTAALPMSPGDAVLRTVGGISIPAGGRFVRVGFDGAGMQCPHPAPSLTLDVVDGGAEHDPWTAPVELCTDPRSSDVGASEFGRVRVGHYLSDSASLVTSGQVDLVLRDNDPGTPGHYNDGAVDELRLLDVTPTLDRAFTATGPIGTGTQTTLVLSVTNTSDLLAKDGWGFHDTLPTGLVVDGAATTSCAGGTLDAASGGGTIGLVGARLDAGQVSCAVQVPVTASGPGTYDAGTPALTALAASPSSEPTVSFLTPTPTTTTPTPGPTHTPTPTPTHAPPSTPPPTGDATGSAGAAHGPTATTDPTTTSTTTPTPTAVAAPSASDSAAAAPFIVSSTPSPPQSPVSGTPTAPASPATGVDADPYSPGYDVDRSTPTAPSVLTGQLPTIAEVVQHPELLASALAAGLVWTLVLVGTTGTLNRSLKTRYDRIAAACQRLVAHPWAAGLARVLGSGHLLVVLTLVAVNASVLAFVDPHLGFDITSLRLIASIATAQLVCGAVPYWVAAASSQRVWQVSAHIRTLPLGLFVGFLGVSMSRLVGFVPGLLAGAVLGLAAPQATTRHQARLEQVEAGCSLVIAAVAWPLTSLIPTDRGWQLVFAHDTAVAVTISAIFGTLIDLLPLAGFPGALVKEQARWSWVVLTSITLAAFIVFVVPQSRYWLDVGGGVARWLGIAAVAALAGVAVVLLLHRGEARRTRAAAEHA